MSNLSDKELRNEFATLLGQDVKTQIGVKKEKVQELKAKNITVYKNDDGGYYYYKEKVFSDDQLDTIWKMEMLKKSNTIKACCIFFVVLTIISICCALLSWIIIYSH